MMLSIITPTLGKPANLQRLFASISEQDCTEKIEIILSATHISRDEVLSLLPPLPSSFSVTVIESAASGIAIARNKGLVSARGKYVFFLDDDCTLPHTGYLSLAIEKLTRGPKAGWGGSYIVNDSVISFSSAFYNYISNMWLKSFYQKEKLNIILGGCAFFSREQLLECGAYFEETADKAAEEFTFSQHLLRQNISVFYSDDLNVRHNPSCTLLSLFKKSWNHGRALGTYSASRRQRRWSTYFSSLRNNSRQALQFFPLLILFLAAGRLAFLLRRMEDTLHTIRKPSLKRS